MDCIKGFFQTLPEKVAFSVRRFFFIYFFALIPVHFLSIYNFNTALRLHVWFRPIWEATRLSAKPPMCANKALDYFQCKKHCISISLLTSGKSITAVKYRLVNNKTVMRDDISVCMWLAKASELLITYQI